MVGSSRLEWAFFFFTDENCDSGDVTESIRRQNLQIGEEVFFQYQLA